MQQPRTPARGGARAHYAHAWGTGELLLLGGLKQHGIDDVGAARLLGLYGPDICRGWLSVITARFDAAAAGGRPIRHRGRYLRRCIETGQLPDDVRPELIALPPRRENAEELATAGAAELEEGAIRELLGGLPEQLRTELEARADAELDASPFLRRAAPSTRDSARNGIVVRLARELLVTTR